MKYLSDLFWIITKTLDDHGLLGFVCTVCSGLVVLLGLLMFLFVMDYF